MSLKRTFASVAGDSESELTDQDSFISDSNATNNKCPPNFEDCGDNYPRKLTKSHPDFYYKPKILKTDIRRNYTTMIANVLNSASPAFLAEFFYEFCRSDLVYSEKLSPVSSTKGGAGFGDHKSPRNCRNVTSPSVESPSLSGLNEYYAYVNRTFEDFPDLVYDFKNTTIRAFSDGTSEITSLFRFEGNMVTNHIMYFDWSAVVPSSGVSESSASTDGDGDATSEESEELSHSNLQAAPTMNTFEKFHFVRSALNSSTSGAVGVKPSAATVDAKADTIRVERSGSFKIFVDMWGYIYKIQVSVDSTL